MPTYKVYGLMTASIVVGTYEAESEEAALEKAENDQQANYYPSVCHQCSHEIDLGDVYKTKAEEA